MGRREQFSVGHLQLACGQTNLFATQFACKAAPVDGLKGYGSGSVAYVQNAALGMVPTWINTGTIDSCKFRPAGPQVGWGIMAAAKKVFVSGTAGLAINIPGFGSDAGDVGFGGYATSDDNDQFNSINVGQTDNLITLTNSTDPLSAHSANWGIMRQGQEAAWDIVFAGTRTTVGGNVAEPITLTGALATDLGFATYSATDDSDVLNQVVMTANTMTVTFQNDPLVAHGTHYMVLRPRGVTRPSHYIAYAGKRTTVGGQVTEAITVTGALATDIVIMGFAVTDDTDVIRKAVLTANTLTITASVDPGATHAHWYMILRAYPTN